jgi:DNA-binding transcriptional LysR family regulator
LSFTRPARRLRISQTALSQQICAIERIVGTDLFIPGQFGSALTTLRIHGNNWSSGPGD